MATKDFQDAYMAAKKDFFEFTNIAEIEIAELENTVHELEKENDFLKIENDDLRSQLYELQKEMERDYE
nr:hypothetical protein [uncultured Kingella sp.]